MTENTNKYLMRLVERKSCTCLVCFQSFSLILLTCCLLVSSGCQQIKDQFNRVRPNNPVVGPAPPRISLEETATDSLGYAAVNKDAAVVSGVLPVSHKQAGELKNFSDAQAVAMVNGNPILAGDIFGPYSKQLAMMKKQLTPEQYAQAQRELLIRDLPSSIERKLLAHAMISTLKQEQIEQLDTIMDNAFKEHVARLLEKTKTATALELEKKLNADGTSLHQLRKTFGEQQLAIQYLSGETELHTQIGRVDLLNYYEKNKADFTNVAQVKWQEIKVSFTDDAERNRAIDELHQIVKELQQGKQFSELALKYSDGITADKGGEWDWTRQGSLSDKKIDEQLFSLQKGQISGVIESPTYFTILKITDRKDAGVTPFEDLQQQIRASILKEKRQEKTAEVVNKLKESSDIETIFDNDPELKEKMNNFGSMK